MEPVRQEYGLTALETPISTIRRILHGVQMKLRIAKKVMLASWMRDMRHSDQTFSRAQQRLRKWSGLADSRLYKKGIAIFRATTRPLPTVPTVSWDSFGNSIVREVSEFVVRECRSRKSKGVDHGRD